MGIDPETATDEQLDQWLKDNPTIISKKSIRNIKTCLNNNCNVTILIKREFGGMPYGYILESPNLDSIMRRYIVQYHNVLNEFRYLQIVWNNNEFYVLDYKFD